MPFMDGIEATTVIGWLAMVAEARSTTLLERAPALETLAAVPIPTSTAEALPRVMAVEEGLAQ
jgi:hypothetical protein